MALDVTTGVLRWHYQFTPHDLHDWDSAHTPVLADLPIGGRVRKVAMVANRNSFFYTLDRETGEVLVGKPFTDNTNWAKELGPDKRPVVLDQVGTDEKCLQDQHGGTGFQPGSFDPARRLYFITAHETCATYEVRKPTPPITMGRRVPDGGPRRLEGREQFAAVRAIDPSTGDRKWEYRFRSYPSNISLDLTGGIMTTAGGLLFTGDNDGWFYALDSQTGKELGALAAPLQYADQATPDGRQWVVTPAEPDADRVRASGRFTRIRVLSLKDRVPLMFLPPRC